MMILMVIWRETQNFKVVVSVDKLWVINVGLVPWRRPGREPGEGEIRGKKHSTGGGTQIACY